MPARRRRKRVVARVQPQRKCSEALSLLFSGGTERAMCLTLGEAVRELWSYAKRTGLQRGKTIMCDVRLRELFGCGQLGMTEVPSALSAHLTGTGLTSSRTPREPAPAPAPTTSNAPLFSLSPALTSLLCGGHVGEGHRPAVMTQAEVLKRVGRYINANNLRDMGDRRRIHCDAALAEIVGKTSFTVSEARSLLLRHTSESGQAGEASAEQAVRRVAPAAAAAPAPASSGGSSGLSTEHGCEMAQLRRRLLEQREAINNYPREVRHGGVDGRTRYELMVSEYKETKARLARLKEGLASTAEGARTLDDASRGAGEECPHSDDQPSTKESAAPPSEYLCPITQELMVDPVSTCDGHTYERAAIAQWLKRHMTSPLTGARLDSSNVIPNISLRKLIQEYCSKQGS
ncbi:hypothetical protein AB1Y20_018073 [Prymnesium parvum]|uniref:U-box domain-containing protein n=1 Tax=Prymnesium parvum TaxID=97485 RepID=A0AB34JME2_PRYPA